MHEHSEENKKEIAANEIGSWTDSLGNAQDKNNGKPTNSKIRNNKTYAKDCKNCRDLTKNCTYTCKNRVKFQHCDEDGFYMREYSARCCSITTQADDSLPSPYPEHYEELISQWQAIAGYNHGNIKATTPTSNVTVATTINAFVPTANAGKSHFNIIKSAIGDNKYSESADTNLEQIIEKYLLEINQTKSDNSKSYTPKKVVAEAYSLVISGHSPSSYSKAERNSSSDYSKAERSSSSDYSKAERSSPSDYSTSSRKKKTCAKSKKLLTKPIKNKENTEIHLPDITENCMVTGVKLKAPLL